MKTKMFKGSVLVAVLILGTILIMDHVGAAEKTYEIHPHVNVGPYGSESLQVAEVFERLMTKQLADIDENIEGNTDKLDLILKEIKEVNKRLARIEKHLNIPEPHKPKPPVPTEKPVESK